MIEMDNLPENFYEEYIVAGYWVNTSWGDAIGTIYAHKINNCSNSIQINFFDWTIE